MFKTNPVSLKNLLDSVDSGKLQLPDFQRPWVWDDDRIRGLLASISRGFPVGAIMTLEAGGEIRLKTKMVEGAEEKPEVQPEAFLLDGQQRLTSLYQSLRHEDAVCTHDNRGKRIRRWYYIDMLAAMDPSVDREDAIVSMPESKQETRDFGREVIQDLSSREREYEQHMIPTERLLDAKLDWLFGYIGHWKDRDNEHPAGGGFAFFEKFSQAVGSAFTEYSLPVISLDKDTPKEAVCTVFQKVNTGGVPLSTFELVTASFAAQDHDFALRDDWDKRKRRLHSAFGSLQGVGGDQFLQAVTLLTTQKRRRRAIAEGISQNLAAPPINCRKNDILGLDVSDYHEWANHVENGFIEAAKFLHSQFIFNRYDVPYSAQLVPLACLYVELGHHLKPAMSKGKLERWFWSGIFSEKYGGGVETQYALDLTQVAAWVRGDSEPVLLREADFNPDRLLSLRTRNSAAYKGLYALQMKSGAADWRTANPLSSDTWYGENIDIHHIFPVAWCEKESESKPKIPRWLYDSIINKTPIDAETNRIIGGSAPSIYLPRLRRSITEEQLFKALQAHWLEPKLMLADQFADCFVKRGEAMLELIGKAMGKQVRSGRETFLNALASAGLELEFLAPTVGADPEAIAWSAFDDYDDTEDEHDAVGDWVLQEESVAAD